MSSTAGAGASVPLDITPDYPPADPARVRSAVEALSQVLRNFPRQEFPGAAAPGHGQRVARADDLVTAVAADGHEPAAAAWAVHECVRAGWLIPEVRNEEVEVGAREEIDHNHILIRAKRYLGDRGRVPTVRIPGRLVPQPTFTGRGPVPFDCLLVRTTPAFWERPGEPSNRADGGTADAPPVPTPARQAPVSRPSAAFPHHEDYLPAGPFCPVADIWPLAERQLRRFELAFEKANRKLPIGPLPDALACWWRREWASAVLSHTAPPDTVADVRALYSFAVTLDRVLVLSELATAQRPGAVEFTYYDRPLLGVNPSGVSRPCYVIPVDPEQERTGGYTPAAFPDLATVDGRYADRAPEANFLLGWRLTDGEFLLWAGFLCEDGGLTDRQYALLARIGYSTRGVEDWCLAVADHAGQCRRIGEQVLDRLQTGIEWAADECRTPAVVVGRGGRFRDALGDVLRWVEEAEAAGRSPPTDTPVERYRRRLERDRGRAAWGDDRGRTEAEERAANWRSTVAVLDGFLAPLFAGRAANPAEVTLALKRVGLMLIAIDARNPPAADQPRVRRAGPVVWNPAAGVVARLRAFDEVAADFGEPGRGVVLAAGLLEGGVDCDLPRIQEQVEFLRSPDGGSALGWVLYLLDRLDPFDQNGEPRDPWERTPDGWRAMPPGVCDQDRRRVDQILRRKDFDWDRELFPSLGTAELLPQAIALDDGKGGSGTLDAMTAGRTAGSGGEGQTVVVPPTTVSKPAGGKRGIKGRKPISAEQDRRIWEGWQTGQHADYAALASAFGLKKREVEKAMERERKRRAPKKAAGG